MNLCETFERQLKATTLDVRKITVENYCEHDDMEKGDSEMSVAVP